MGLLDYLSSDDAKDAMGLLAAAGPSTVPMNTFQRIQMAQQGSDARKDAEMKRQYLKSQIDENSSQVLARKLQAERDQQINALVARRIQSNGGMSGGTQTSGPPGTPGGSQAYGGYSWAGMPGASDGVSVGVNPAIMSQQMGGQPMGQRAGPQGVAQGGGSAFPFTLDDITSLQSLGYKGADGLFNLYKYANDGIKREGGNYYRDPITGQERYYPKLDNGMAVGPGGMVQAAPGYAAANAGIKGAETDAVERAKYPFTVGADRSRQVTSAQLDTVPIIGEDGNTYMVPRYNVATGQGAAGGQSGAGGFMSARNPINQHSAIAINDNWIKSSYQPTLDAGKTAADMQASIQAIRNIDLATGWGTEQKASGAAFLEGLGIAPGNAGLFASNAQKFQSVAMDRLQTALVAQKGTQTEGDADRAGKTFAALKNTPEANAFILDFAQAKANMDQRRAQYYEQALPLAQKSGDLTRVDREWRKIQGSIWADPILQRWAK